MIKNFFNSAWNFSGISEDSYSFDNVYVHPKSGAIFDAKFEPIFDVLYEVLYWNPAIRKEIMNDKDLLEKELAERKHKISQMSCELREEITRSIANKDISRFALDGEFVYLLHPFGWYAYGHLHDTLMRLYPLRELKNKDQLNLLCSDFRRVIEFEEHLSALGYNPNNIFEQRQLPNFIFVKRLHVGINPATVTSYTPETYNWMKKSYIEYFNRQKSDDFSHVKGLYLSRNLVKAGSRGVLNEGDVIEYLAPRGFVVLDGTQKLSDVVNYFSTAKYIIGPHGSLLANVMFADKDCKIIEFCPSNRPDGSFRSKYKDAESYNQVLVDADENFNIKIDIEQLEEFLND